MCISRSIECDALRSLACSLEFAAFAQSFLSGASRSVKYRASLWPSFSTKLERCVKLYIGLMSCSIEYTGITLIQRVLGILSDAPMAMPCRQQLDRDFELFDFETVASRAVYGTSTMRTVTIS